MNKTQEDNFEQLKLIAEIKKMLVPVIKKFDKQMKLMREANKEKENETINPNQ